MSSLKLDLVSLPDNLIVLKASLPLRILKCSDERDERVGELVVPLVGPSSFSSSDLLLQSTDQFFLFALLWTTQYTACSIAPSAYKYSTSTCTSCPAHIDLTTCPTHL